MSHFELNRTEHKKTTILFVRAFRYIYYIYTAKCPRGFIVDLGVFHILLCMSSWAFIFLFLNIPQGRCCMGRNYSN